MTDNEHSIIDMTDVVDEAFIEHAAEIAGKIFFENLVTEFRARKTLIDQLALIAGKDISGVTIDKADARLLLEVKGYRIGRAIYTWAMSTGSDSIAKPVKDSVSSLRVLKDNDFKYEMMRYLEYAQDNALALVDFEVSAGDITDFEEAITDFRDWKADPRFATSQRKTAARELSRAIIEIAFFLTNRVDPAMYVFEGSGTSFFGDYFNARIIVDPAGPDSQTQTGINPIETDTIINLPFTNLGANKAVRIKCITPGTNFEIYCSNAPSVPPTGTPLSINDVISPINTTTDDLGWLPDSPYINIHFPPLPVEIEWEVRVG